MGKNHQGISKFLAPLIVAFIFLVTLNMRPAITAMGPLLDQIAASFSLEPSQVGLLGALPLLMFAFLSPLAPTFAARLGLDRAIMYALIAIAVGIVLRSYAGALGLWIGLAIATGAIAVGNVLVPVIVKRDYPGHISLTTGIYSASMGLGASVASGLAVPVAEFGGWQFSLAVWAFPAGIVALLWLPRALKSTGQAVAKGQASVNVWRSPYAWCLTFMMGLQSATFYFSVTWLPTIEVVAGATTKAAGMTLFWYQVAGIIAGLFVPLLMKNKDKVLRATLIASLPLFVAYVGFLVIPQHGLVLAIILGIGSGMSLVVTLSLISLRSTVSDEVAKLSGMVQSVGYLIAALAPALAGVLVQITGQWKSALWMMLIMSGLQLIVATILGRSSTPSATNTEK